MPHNEINEPDKIIKGDCGYGDIDVYYYKDLVICHEKDKSRFILKFPPITLDVCEVIVTYNGKIKSCCTRGFIDVNPDKKEEVQKKYIDTSEWIAEIILSRNS